MARMDHLPIWRDANRLLVVIEEAVRRFPRYHKYTLGTDLRRQAMGICRLIVRAYNEKTNRPRHVRRLSLAVDDLKVLVQLGKEVRALWARVCPSATSPASGAGSSNNDRTM
ncbi:MAG TPA: four helix bundle protein [Gammaproteobacteria bacterium]|nr:four helix bundle protein [Gammaproteobacteria bacterium]